MNPKEQLYRGIKCLFGALPLFFLGPVVMSSSFKNQQNQYYHFVLGAGILISILAVFLMYRGINLIIKSIFQK